MKKRVKIREFIHAAEGVFMMHATPIVYARWHAPASMSESGDLEVLERGLVGNVRKDVDWLERELEENGSGYLVGDGMF